MKAIYPYLTLCFISMLCISCGQKTKADLIVINSNVYTVDDAFSVKNAFAIKDGKFLRIGSDIEILNNYESDDILDFEGKTVVPGLIDAHCHFYNMGLFEEAARFEGAKTFKEVVQRIVDFEKDKKPEFIKGRGWDQNDWDVQTFPTKDTLDLLFPDTPIAITRIDGHALLVNQAALDLTDLSAKTKISGGEIILNSKGEMTGVLIDAAMQPVINAIPEPSRNEKISILKTAEDICFSYGLTTVDDAGLPRATLELIDSLQGSGDLSMRIYAMVSGNKENLDYYLAKGISKTDRLNIRSFKFYGDGALGSRGAALRRSYSDRDNHFGALVNSLETLENTAQRIADSEFQMNTHAIGDSTNHVVLETYQRLLADKGDRRWRIEHAQIVSPEDFQYFDKIIPSIQPTHATSDMYWAEDRIGAERIKGAYSFKDLLAIHGKVVLGTDFPVEQVNPFLTFYASVSRRDLNGYPSEGFRMDQALSREETLRGMTIWAAYSNFEEAEKGSIEVGKFADFTVLSQDLMTIDYNEIPKTTALYTFVNGTEVYKAE